MILNFERSSPENENKSRKDSLETTNRSFVMTSLSFLWWLLWVLSLYMLFSLEASFTWGPHVMVMVMVMVIDEEQTTHELMMQRLSPKNFWATKKVKIKICPPNQSSKWELKLKDFMGNSFIATMKWAFLFLYIPFAPLMLKFKIFIFNYLEVIIKNNKSKYKPILKKKCFK